MIAAPFSAGHPTRAVARSAKGMIATPHPAATLAGADVLRRGGNAVDAAIAANAVLSVVYPAMCGLGGDAFWMVYEPTTPEVVCYNGSGRAARKLDAHRLREQGLSQMPIRGALSVTVPGAVRSWEDVAAVHGKFGLDDLLQPAEYCAREGYVVTGVLERYLSLNAGILEHDPDAAALLLYDGLPRAGMILRNPGLATVLAQIRAGGADAFYDGPAAQAIVAKLQWGGNPMEAEDLHEHRTERTRPWRLPWRDGEVLAHPPNSQGSTAQIALGAIEDLETADDAAWAHVAIEAFKHAFGVRDTRFGDPDVVSIREEDVLAPELLREVRDAIDPERVTARFGGPDRGDTVAIVAVDDEGRAVSLIESLFMNFGSCLVAGETGIVLQNRGAYFNLVDGHPNELRGGRRPVHTLSPAMYMRDHKPELVYGAMGGDGQPQIHVQLLHNVYERRMPLQQAIDAPRWVAGRPHIPGHDDMMTQVVVVESRMPPDVVAGLERRGHRVATLEDFDSAVGHAQMIQVDRKRGTLAGAADPRADSFALGI